MFANLHANLTLIIVKVSHPKSVATAYIPKSWPDGNTSQCKFQLPSLCNPLWPGLNREGLWSSFQSVESNVVFELLLFCFTKLSDWLIRHVPLSQPITKPKLTESARTRFPAPNAYYLNLFQCLIGSFCVLLLL